VRWLAVSVRPDAGRRGAVLETLFAAGSRAVEEVGDDLRTYLPPDSDRHAVIRALWAASPGARVDTAQVLLPAWDSAWRNGLRTHRAGRLTIAPPWLAAGLKPTSTVVVDPGMAFGTGDHPTTRGVLRLMGDVIRPGDRVADLGAGSAVLSIAAAKLGAGRVAAIELDTDAIGNAEANVRANGVGDRVSVLGGDAAVLLPLVAPVRVVLANIGAQVILELLTTIRCALDANGEAIVGGIIKDERPAFVGALREAGLAVRAEDGEEDWWSAAVARR
jgi:ribosomal protein L11 methyltransferase